MGCPRHAWWPPPPKAAAPAVAAASSSRPGQRGGRPAGGPRSGGVAAAAGGAGHHAFAGRSPKRADGATLPDWGALPEKLPGSRPGTPGGPQGSTEEGAGSRERTRSVRARQPRGVEAEAGPSCIGCPDHLWAPDARRRGPHRPACTDQLAAGSGPCPATPSQYTASAHAAMAMGPSLYLSATPQRMG